MDIEHESMEACVHRYAVTCELIFGQPESYYRELLRRNTIEPVDFGSYHLLITGLHRKVYRPFLVSTPLTTRRVFEKPSGKSMPCCAHRACSV